MSQLILSSETIQHIARDADTVWRTLAGTMGQALAGFPTLDRGSSTTKQIHSVPTRAYQTDQPSSHDVPVSDNALDDDSIYPLQMCALKTSTKGDRNLCFLIDINNHISTLLLNFRQKK